MSERGSALVLKDLQRVSEEPGQQDAQNDIPARPQEARRLKRTLGVRCRETGN